MALRLGLDELLNAYRQLVVHIGLSRETRKRKPVSTVRQALPLLSHFLVSSNPRRTKNKVRPPRDPREGEPKTKSDPRETDPRETPATLWRCPSRDPLPCGNTLMRHGVLGVVPASGPQRGTPFAPRGPVGPVPPLRRYYGALRLLAVHLAALRFLRLASTTVSSPIRPHRLGTGAVDQPGVGKPGSSRQPRWRPQGLPSSRETRLIIRHVPTTPV
jgi:hypothetical protein